MLWPNEQQRLYIALAKGLVTQTLLGCGILLPRYEVALVLRVHLEDI